MTLAEECNRSLVDSIDSPVKAVVAIALLALIGFVVWCLFR